MSALNIATWLSKSKLLQGDIEQGECKELKNRGALRWDLERRSLQVWGENEEKY